jgi:hypothetical protein
MNFPKIKEMGFLVMDIHIKFFILKHITFEKLHRL